MHMVVFLDIQIRIQRESLLILRQLCQDLYKFCFIHMPIEGILYKNKNKLYFISKGSAFYGFDHFQNNFIKYFLHLNQNNCQNIRTPPLPSYRVTPTLLQGNPFSPIGHPLLSQRAPLCHLLGQGSPSRRLVVALQEDLGPYILGIFLVQMPN